METYHSKFVEMNDKVRPLIRKGHGDQIREFFAVPKLVDMEDLIVKVVLWNHLFLPDYFWAKSPEFHYGIVRKFFSNRNEYAAYPRGFGKTSVIQGCMAYSAANLLDEFVVLVEKSFNEASEVLESLRDEMKNNEDIIGVYGDLSRIDRRGRKDDKIKDAEGDFFINGIRFRAKGFEAPVRGIKSRHTRPSRIVLDDVESDEHINNPEQRQKYLNRYIKGLIPAESNSGGSIKAFGTILHDDSLLSTLIRNHGGEIYRAWDGQRKLLWPGVWTVEALEKKRRDMAIEGKGDSSFYQEYFNEPLADEDRTFRREMFRYFNDFQLEEVRKKPHKCYILIDPAISKKNWADFTAIVCLIVDQHHRIYVAEIMRERMTPYDIVNSLFAMYERWRPNKVGIEVVAYQKSLKYIVEREKRLMTGSVVNSMVIAEIKADQDKERKIGKMQDRYARGLVYHKENDPMTAIMEGELVRFPKGATDDIIDAMSGVEQLITPILNTTEKGYNKYRQLTRRHHVAY